MKKVLILFILFVFVIFLTKDDGGYDLKISLKIDNLSSFYIDKNVTNKITMSLMQDSSIKDIVTISSRFGCNIYCKLKTFISNKAVKINSIENLVLNEVNNFKEVKNVKFDDNYNDKYDYFLVVSDDDYYKLKEKVDILLEKVLNLKISKNIDLIGLQQKVNYIYYNDSDFVKYGFNIEDIKKTIQKNNLSENKLLVLNEDNLYSEILKVNFENIDDIKKMRVFYNNSKYSIGFDEVFDIRKEIKKPLNELVLDNGKKAIVLGISKKSFYPDVLAYFKIINLNIGVDFKLIKPIFKKQIEIYLTENIDINGVLEFLKNNLILSDDTLIFLGRNLGKVLNNISFDEIKENRILILCDFFQHKKIMNYLKEKNIDVVNSKEYFVFDENPFELVNEVNKIKNKIIFATNTKNNIMYNCNDFRLSDFNISKKDLFEKMQSNRFGLVLGNYLQGLDSVEIVLKNKNLNSGNYIYSEKYNTLVDEKFFVNENIVSDFEVLAKKNNKYFSIIKLKNPSILRRVSLHFRCLLSL